jgi:hypothetical protein
LSGTSCTPLTKFCVDQPYTWMDCFKFNQYYWFPGFLAGLHFTFADRGPMKKI